MKILLLKPPITLPKQFSGINTRFSQPIGLGYIASMLEKNGYDDVKIIDTGIEDWKRINKRYDGKEYAGMNFGDIKKIIEKELPDIIGITSMTPDATNAFIISKLAKEVSSDIKTMMGGPHACAMPEETLMEGIDFVCIGEGEYMFLELVEELEKESPKFENIKGMWFKEDGKIIKNEPRPPIENLDELPFPARHLMNYKKYFEANKYLQGAREIEKRRDTIITSRGCPFNCVFCSIKISMGRTFRPRSPENVVTEIEEMVSKYNIGNISFEDDNFTFNMERAHKICDLIIERGLNKKISWDTPNGIRADRVDEKLLIKMQKAGCKEVVFSPESGNQYVVNNLIGKKLDLKKVEEDARICKKIGMKCRMFFVMGIPGETKNQINDTVEFAKRMKEEYCVEPMLFSALPYYSTDLYRICKENGYLIKIDKSSFEQALIGMEPMISPPEFTPEYIARVKKEFIKDEHKILRTVFERPLDSARAFILHPKHVLKYLVKKAIK